MYGKGRDEYLLPLVNIKRELRGGGSSDVFIYIANVATVYLCPSLFSYFSLEKLKRWCWIVTLDA